MTILITGANGQVGQSLQLAFKPFSGKVRFLNRHELDITDKVAIEKQIQQSNASLIINAAAYTQVDLAETERESCSLINTLGAENLARSCAAANIPLLHFSTDYVFDGKKIRLTQKRMKPTRSTTMVYPSMRASKPYEIT